MKPKFLSSNIGFRVSKRLRLCSTKLGQCSRKWWEVSAFALRWQVSSGVSWNFWFFLWLLRGLKPTLSWKIHLIQFGSWISNKLLISGRYIFKMFFLKIDKDSAPRFSGPKRFHKMTLSGKKLSRYLSVSIYQVVARMKLVAWEYVFRDLDCVI